MGSRSCLKVLVIILFRTCTRLPRTPMTLSSYKHYKVKQIGLHRDQKMKLMEVIELNASCFQMLGAELHIAEISCSG